MSTAPLPPSSWLSIREIAHDTGFNRSTIERWLRRGDMPYLNLADHGIRVRRSDYELWKAQRERQTRTGGQKLRARQLTTATPPAG